MTHVAQMVETYPAEIGMDRALLGRCIDAAVDCAQSCTACADACLSENEVGDLRKCVRTCLDCADVCATTARVLSRHTGYDANLTRAVVTACVTACAACVDECRQHATQCDHCRICADVCGTCRQRCQEALAAIG
jgi:hypothetical protein